MRFAKLMAKAQGGSVQDYITLLTDITPWIRAFCKKRVGYLGMTEDIVQEVLISIHKARHTYDPKRKFGPWLFAITRYTMIDYLRSQTRFSKQTSVEDDVLDRLINSANMETRDEPEGKEIMNEAIESLDPMYKEVLILTKVKGLSIRETASSLGIGESAVKVRAHRAVSMLKKKIRGAVNE